MERISNNEYNDFIEYIDEFYGYDGIYAHQLNGGFSIDELEAGVEEYLNSITASQWGGGDSIDREKVREILQDGYSWL
tara:strand:- start:339 stop:572 length:234 start_codon:yes stop_codon:yes gene_type:complete